MPASKAQQKAVSKYMKANYDEIKIRIHRLIDLYVFSVSFFQKQ